jgi:3',5'-cyclic AMP phosphodiesterase CpdA
MRIALIADAHVAPRAPECVHNWHVAARAVVDLNADLTLHLGDITLDGEHRPEELDFAAELIEDWPTPIRCVSGNHDIGTGSGEQPLSAHRLSRYCRTIGADRWMSRHDGWVLFGLNAQLMGAGGRAEAAQWEWLEAVAAGLDATDRAIVLLHRPLSRPPGDQGMPTGRYVRAVDARRLMQGPLRRTLAFVISGHTHQALDFAADGVRHVWVPSSAFVIPDAMQVRIGAKVVGLGMLTLQAGRAQYECVYPAPMRQSELTGLACFAALEVRSRDLAPVMRLSQARQRKEPPTVLDPEAPGTVV